MVTLKELQKKLAKQRKRIGVEERKAIRKAQADLILSKHRKAIRKAQADLILSKHRKAIAIAKKAKTISGKFGRALLRTGIKVGKKVGPAIVKQGRLIQEQQQRDNARERALLKKPTKKTKKIKSKSKSRRKTNDNLFDLDF